MIGIQNFSGLKVGGNDETSKDNMLGNALKWFTKTEDEVAMKWTESMIGKRKVLKSDIQLDSYGNAVSSSSTKLEEESVFDITMMRDFDKGMSLILAGSEANKVIPMQSFYRGGKTSTVQLKRFVPIAS